MSDAPVTILRPRRGWIALDLPELWRFRELLGVFVVRDLKVRYRQTLLGIAWAVLQPLAAAAIFALFLGRFAQVPSEGFPYFLYTYVGMAPWSYLSYVLTGAASSVSEQRAVVTKVYFPKLILPLVPSVAGLVDLGFALLVLGGLMFWYGFVPPLQAFALPLLILLASAAGLAVGIWLAALNALYRDFRFVVPFLIQIWLFATPVVYPLTVVPQKWHLLYGLNPMVGVVEGFRWAVLGTPRPPGTVTAISAGAVVLIFLGGLVFFRRMERRFGDLL